MTKTKRTLSGLLITFLGLLLIVAPNARALELVISENGSGSGNEVNVQVETTTEVTQTNEADVSNNVQTDANTGDNEASDNTGGDVGIETGDAVQDVSTSTSVNNSEVDIGCCPSDTNIEIKGNGADSQNNVNLNQASQTTVVINQTAKVSNYVDGSANTGENTANNNTGGNVAIDTGNINVTGGINNDPINSATVKAGWGGGNVSARISGNGAGSTNNITANLANNSDVFLNFNAHLNNFVNWDLNTGRNHADGNTGGDVSIKTGDIDFSFFINNLANIGQVDISCCDVFDPGEPPGDGGPPPNGGPDDPHDPGDPGDGGGDGGGGGGDGGGGGAGGGGEGILGLSDTSSDLAQTIFFWAGIAMLIIGARLIGKETSGKLSA